jgi:hypothetical protein
MTSFPVPEWNDSLQLNKETINNNWDIVNNCSLSAITYNNTGVVIDTTFENIG